MKAGAPLSQEAVLNVSGESLSSTLIENFKLLHAADGTPAWAWPYPPSIPFIGTNYPAGGGLVIYASAENFSWMNDEPVPARFRDDRAWNRYRAQVEEDRATPAGFFPTVGIAPVENGLLAGGLFVAMTLGLPTRDLPWEFLETIAVTNVGKFSVQNATNLDYIVDEGKITASVGYLINELVLLRPQVVMIPTAIWRHPILQRAMRGASPRTRFLPIPQFNAQVMNIHLKKFEAESLALQTEFASTPLAQWMDNVRGTKKPFPWRYFAALNSQLK